MPPSNDLPIDDISGVEERPQNRREWRGALRSLVLPLLIVATIVGVLLYVEQRGAGDAQLDHGLGVVAFPPGLNPPNTSTSTDIGDVAPDFVLETPDGEQLRFSDLRGKPVLVNFWASWCGPCREEMPEIVRAYGAHAVDGLVVLAINLQENDSQVREFATDFGMTFPIVIDRTGQIADAWRIGGPVEGIPASYFVDAEGVVRARSFGPMTADTIEEHLSSILIGDAP
ncbi:MAG: TlpA disulfide reductase family protein [Dehalococcoidia bacterium]